MYFTYGKEVLVMSKKEKGKGLMAEFKEFIMRGNVMDLAVGVIIGGAFTAIVTSLNEDILSPIIALVGGTDFSHLKVALGTSDSAPILYYGKFITALINFFITSLVIFLIIKGINGVSKKVAAKLKKEQEEEEAKTEKECPYCKSMIKIEATRCPNCTSQLPEEVEATPEEA